MKQADTLCVGTQAAEVVEWPFESIRHRLVHLEKTAFIRRNRHTDRVEVVDRRTGAVIQQATTGKMLEWWNQLVWHLDSVFPPKPADS